MCCLCLEYSESHPGHQRIYHRYQNLLGRKENTTPSPNTQHTRSLPIPHTPLKSSSGQESNTTRYPRKPKHKKAIPNGETSDYSSKWISLTYGTFLSLPPPPNSLRPSFSLALSFIYILLPFYVNRTVFMMPTTILLSTSSLLTILVEFGTDATELHNIFLGLGKSFALLLLMLTYVTT